MPSIIPEGLCLPVGINFPSVTKKKAVFFLTLTQDHFPLPHLQDSLNIWPYASLLGYGLMDCYR